MSYVAIVKALYDYEAQDPAEELSFKEDQIVYVIDKEDDQWWKAKLKPEDDVEDKVGLIPANYVEQVQPISHSRALYAYEATAEDELTIDEDNILAVYEHQADWDLVRIVQPIQGESVGFVPGNYTEALQEGEADDLGLAKGRLEDGGLARVVDPEEPMGAQDDTSAGMGAAAVGAGAAAAAAAAASYASPAEKVEASHQAAGGANDEIQTWSISELDKKGKKKKGTLGIGNGAVFFASETDKAPVQQFPITTLLLYSMPSSKTLLLQFSSVPDALQYHCGDKATTEAIMAKLKLSKEVSEGGGQGAPPSASAEREVGGLGGLARTETPPKEVRFQSPTNDTFTPPPPPQHPGAMLPPPQHPGAGSRQSSSTTPTQPAAAAGVKKAVALYDFDAQGDDELTITDGEDLTIIEMDNDDWWMVKNAKGKQGVVPAQYVELSAGEASQPMTPVAGEDPAAAKREADEAEAAARLAEEREQEQERQRREEEEAEQREREHEARRREEKERRRAERERRRREEEAARRRELARQAPPPEPPKLKQRPSANDVAAAKNLNIPKGRDAPNRPQGGDSGSGRSRPNPSRTRVWHDKTGQFRVEAEFLGMGNGKIRLHKLNGVVIEVPLEKMSPEDVAYLKRVQRKEREKTARQSRVVEFDDDLPLDHIIQSRPPPQSSESQARTEPSPAQQPQAARPQQSTRPKRKEYDWFAFFLEAGCDMDDCSRYASNFEKDRIDESILPELDSNTLRSLGLRQGDVIRVRKAISSKFRTHTSEELDQIKKDEEYAKMLQDQENNGGGGASGGGSGSGGRGSPGNLFTGPDGKLTNNTRRGRPERKGTNASSTIDTSVLAAAKPAQPSPPLLAPSPPPAPPAPPAPPPPSAPAAQPSKPAITGFDDDAWTVKPESNHSSAPAASSSTPQPSVTNQLGNLNLNKTNTGGSASNDFLSQIPQNKIVSPNATGMPQSYHAGLGMGASNVPMGQIQQQQQTGGPLAPVPANQGLLNPLVSTTTGFNGFIPTRQSPLNTQPTGMGSSNMNMNATGTQQQQQQMMSQPTGFGGANNMMSQPTGYTGMNMMSQPTGFTGGMGQQQTGFPGMQQPQMTGMQNQQNAMFNQLSAIAPQKTGMPQNEGTKYDPANIFAKMKRGDQGTQNTGPQSADKYDALRPQATGLMPLTTGYSGAMPQQNQMSGMMPQQTGYNPMMMMGGGAGQMGMQGQQNPYMQQQQTGFMGRQGGYGF